MENQKMHQHDNDSAKEYNKNTDKKDKQKDVCNEIVDTTGNHCKGGKKPPIKWGSIGEVLNKMLRQGDKIEVFNGADQIDKIGSFIAATDDYLIWSDSHGDVNIQNIGGALSVRKTGSKKKSSKHKKHDKKNSNNDCHRDTVGDYKNDLAIINNVDDKKDMIEEILNDVKELKINVESTLENNIDVDNPAPPIVTETP